MLEGLRLRRTGLPPDVLATLQGRWAARATRRCCANVHSKTRGRSAAIGSAAVNHKQCDASMYQMTVARLCNGDALLPCPAVESLSERRASLAHEAGPAPGTNLRSSAVWSDFAAGTGVPAKAVAGGAAGTLDAVLQDTIAKQVTRISRWPAANCSTLHIVPPVYSRALKPVTVMKPARSWWSTAWCVSWLWRNIVSCPISYLTLFEIFQTDMQPGRSLWWTAWCVSWPRPSRGASWPPAGFPTCRAATPACRRTWSTCGRCYTRRSRRRRWVASLTLSSNVEREECAPARYLGDAVSIAAA